MKKILGTIILTAFTLGLVSETVFSVLDLLNCKGIPLHVGIELCVAWFIVLVTFIVASVRGFSGAPRMFGISLSVRPPEETPETHEGNGEETPSETPDNAEGSDGNPDGDGEETPSETPEEGTTQERNE